MNHQTLSDIIASLSKKNIPCGITADIICERLNKMVPSNWSLEEHYNQAADDLLNRVKQLLKDGRFIMCDLDIFHSDPETHLEHCFCIVGTDQGDQIVDSYIRTRPPNVRSINIEELGDLFRFPTVERWNRLFMCHEDINSNQAKADVFLTIQSYHDT